MPSNTYSVRTLLFGLVVICVCPPFLIAAWFLNQDAQDQIAVTKSHVYTLALANSINVGRSLKHFREVLEAVAQRPLVRAVDRSRCDPVLGQYRVLAGNVANLITVNLSGIVVCSAVAAPDGKVVSVADTEWFSSALAEHGIPISKPLLGPFTANRISIVALPLYDDNKHLAGFVGLSIDLSSYEPDFPARTVPSGSRYGILTADGVLLWRNIDQNNAIGKVGKPSTMVRTLLTQGDGNVDGVGSDGVARFYAIAPVPGTKLFGYVGVPSQPTYASITRRALDNFLLTLVGLLAVIAISTVISRKIANPIIALVSTAIDLKAGNRNVRAKIKGLRETRLLADAFNALVDDWQNAERGLRNASAEVEDLYQNAPCGYHSIDGHGNLIRINNTELRWLGYGREEMMTIGLTFADFLTKESRARFEQEFSGKPLRDGEIREIELEYVRKDQTILPVLISTSGLFDAAGDYVRSRSMVLDLTERVLRESHRAEQAQRIEMLSHRLVSVHEQETRLLATELHDGTSANLAALGTCIRRIETKLPLPLSDDLAALLADTRAVLEDTTNSIRDICSDLRPPILDYAGLLPALESYARRYTRQTGIAVRIESSPLDNPLDETVETVFFRIAHEALTNCAKHSQASEISIALGKSASGHVVLSVSDNGVGFAPELLNVRGALSGLGVISMRERAEFIGAEFAIDSSPNQGTRITVQI
jgi:PAS domain S-box-containing protein